MAFGRFLPLHVTCEECGRVHTVAGHATRVRCDCGAAFDPSSRPTVADPLVGRMVDGFRIDGIIGRGAMGSVYRARQASLGRPVALKVLPAEFAGDEGLRRRFLREAGALAALSHPNVVQVFDRGEVDGRPYLVLELVEGETLRDLLRAGPVPAHRACRLVAAVCDALAYAHARGVVHRDIKPENVLVSSAGVVKVADFGLARVVDGTEAATRLTVSHLRLGTYEYLAPELREGEREADERSDVYAAAVVLYEMLTGELPIGRFELPSERRPHLDARLDAIVERGLAKAPAERYAGAGAMARDLGRLLSSPDRRVDFDGWMEAARRVGRDVARTAKDAVRRFRARRRPDRAGADDRVRTYRRHRREAIVLNEKVKRVFGLLALASFACWFFVGYPAYHFKDEVAFFWSSGVVTGAAWIALHLLNRQVERGRWLSANAALWSVFSPFSRTAADRARRLRREARALRRMGLSTA